MLGRLCSNPFGVNSKKITTVHTPTTTFPRQTWQTPRCVSISKGWTARLVPPRQSTSTSPQRNLLMSPHMQRMIATPSSPRMITHCWSLKSLKSLSRPSQQSALILTTMHYLVWVSPATVRSSAQQMSSVVQILNAVLLIVLNKLVSLMRRRWRHVGVLLLVSPQVLLLLLFLQLLLLLHSSFKTSSTQSHHIPHLCQLSIHPLIFILTQNTNTLRHRF